MSLLIIGSIAFDGITTPSAKKDRVLGGSATYSSISASYFSKNIQVHSVVGKDFSDEYFEVFKKRNIDTTHIRVLNDQKTFYWAGRYLQDMNTRETITTELNALSHFEPQKSISANQEVEVLSIGNLQPEIQIETIACLSKRPSWIIMDTINYWIENQIDTLKELFHQIDILCINHEEALQLSNTFSLPVAARKIIEMGVRYLIVKKGEHGALLFSKKDTFYLPSFLIEHIEDPTGAGDVFAGALAGYLQETKEEGKTKFQILKKAMLYATSMASFCIQSFGVSALMDLNKRMIEERVVELQKITTIE